MKNTKVLFAIGQGSLAIGLIINHFFAKNLFVFFLIGLFTILSITANIMFLVNKGREMKAKKEQQ